MGLPPGGDESLAAGAVAERWTFEALELVKAWEPFDRKMTET